MNVPSVLLASRADNSTSPLSWISDSGTRSVYDIVSTCVSTMVICVWSAVHMNIPTRPEGIVRSSIKKLGWVVIGILLPDGFLLLAICEFIAAVILLRKAYLCLDDLPPPPSGWLYKYVLLRNFHSSYKASTLSWTSLRSISPNICRPHLWTRLTFSQ